MAIRPCGPDVRRTPSGYLATTPREHPYRIGVIGDDKEEAKRRFVRALAFWEELSQRRTGGGVDGVLSGGGDSRW